MYNIKPRNARGSHNLFLTDEQKTSATAVQKRQSPDLDVQTCLPRGNPRCLSSLATSPDYPKHQYDLWWVLKLYIYKNHTGSVFVCPKLVIILPKFFLCLALVANQFKSLLAAGTFPCNKFHLKGWVLLCIWDMFRLYPCAEPFQFCSSGLKPSKKAIFLPWSCKYLSAHFRCVDTFLLCIWLVLLMLVPQENGLFCSLRLEPSKKRFSFPAFPWRCKYLSTHFRCVNIFLWCILFVQLTLVLQ